MNSTAILSYIILAFTIGYAFVYPSFGEISSLLDEEQKYQESLDKVASIESRKSQLLTEFNRISMDDRDSINAVVPDSLNFTKLIADIDAVASRHGISIDQVSKTVLDSSTGSSIGEAGSPKSYSSGIVSFTFSSSYQRFEDFIDDLEKSLRILDIRSLSVKVGEGSSYSFQVDFEAYWVE